jgi:hypothetical protein
MTGNKKELLENGKIRKTYFGGRRDYEERGGKELHLG